MFVLWELWFFEKSIYVFMININNIGLYYEFIYEEICLADRQGDILQFCVAYAFVVAVCH